jgi:poly(3-hydroxyoctanoate) depolymerase
VPRPLVFLPGAGGSSSFWRPVADRLADLGPALLLGYPGFDGAPPDPGLRSLDDLHRWTVERLPPGPSHVIAQSMGGILAARLAAEQPERVDRLVLVATSGGVDVSALGAADWRPGQRASLPGVPDWFLDDRTDLTDRLAAIRAPTLLVWSDADPVSPLAVARFLAGRIGGARIATVAGGSHSFARERPDEVASILRSHLARPDGSRARQRERGAGRSADSPRVIPLPIYLATG